MEKAKGIDNQIILYAKNWYGRSENIIEDIKTIISKECYIDHVTDYDVYQCLCNVFAEYATKNPVICSQTIMELIGKYFINCRKPEQIIIGQLSIIDGEFVNMKEKKDYKFGK